MLNSFVLSLDIVFPFLAFFSFSVYINMSPFQVLNILLDTLSSSLITTKSDTTIAGQSSNSGSSSSSNNITQTAIENLVSYICDRMRMDISSIVRSKFNTFFLLAFYEDLAAHFRREVDEYLAATP